MPVYVEMVKDKNGNKIEKLIDGKKQYYIRTYVTDEFGCKKQITRHNKEWLGRDGEKEAYQEEAKLQYKKYNKYEKMTLNDLFDLYIKNLSKEVKISTVSKNQDNYNLYIRNNLGNIKVFELSNEHIFKFHEYLSDKKNIIKKKESKRNLGEYKLSFSYMQSIHITLNAILNFGCKYIGLQKNVASIVGNFKKPKGIIRNKISYLTVDEFKEFIKCEQNETYRDFFTILFYTGMRRGELLALTINDINFKTKEININKSLNPKNGLLSTVPKTDASNRKIKITEIVYEILKKYINNNDDCIFGLNKIKLTTLQRRCDNNCRQANINKNIRIHDFRHSFASLCIFNKIPIEIISKYLGHENISTTLDTYAHLYPNSQDVLINVLNKQDQKQDQAK